MCNKPRRSSSIILLNSIGSHVAADVQSSADWPRSVLCQTHKVVMEVQDETLGEMVPVSPKLFTALQTARAGRSFAALIYKQGTTRLCSASPTGLTAIRGRGVHLGKQQAGALLY